MLNALNNNAECVFFPFSVQGLKLAGKYSENVAIYVSSLPEDPLKIYLFFAPIFSLFVGGLALGFRPFLGLIIIDSVFVLFFLPNGGWSEKSRARYAMRPKAVENPFRRNPPPPPPHPLEHSALSSMAVRLKGDT